MDLCAVDRRGSGLERMGRPAAGCHEREWLGRSYRGAPNERRRCGSTASERGSADQQRRCIIIVVIVVVDDSFPQARPHPFAALHRPVHQRSSIRASSRTAAPVLWSSAANLFATPRAASCGVARWWRGTAPAAQARVAATGLVAR